MKLPYATLQVSLDTLGIITSLNVQEILPPENFDKNKYPRSL